MTCVEYDLPVINIILNNNYLGMVRQWQTMFYEIDYQKQIYLLNQIFKMLVEAFGGLGYRVTTKDEFDALKDAVERKKDLQ